MSATEQREVHKFVQTVQAFYQKEGRDLPWRRAEPDGSYDVYKILVSEIMLQQTQVPRVIPKFQTFMTLFPTVEVLAAASLGDVLTAWSGLGYNRRAKYLHQAAKVLASINRPWNYDDLVALKGIGPNTAAAVCVYAYNKPLVFVETNIRTVYIHHFFAHQDAITDKQLYSLIASSLEKQDPRRFYWALMDYGATLKRKVGNTARKSKHYTRQPTFEGSTRQVRGRIIRLLTERRHSQAELQHTIGDERTLVVLETLRREGLIIKVEDSYRLG